jgi:hypothetical protein
VNTFLKIVSVSSVVLVTGCSTIVDSGNQTLNVKALHENKEVTGATCRLQNSKGEWTTVTPQSVAIKTAWADLEVACRKGAAVGNKTVKSSAKGSTFGNILIGGGIGALVDAGTGAGYSYPDTFTVDMIGDINRAP